MKYNVLYFSVGDHPQEPGSDAACSAAEEQIFLASLHEEERAALRGVSGVKWELRYEELLEWNETKIFQSIIISLLSPLNEQFL